MMALLVGLLAMPGESHAETTLKNIRERGYLSCGVRQDQTGFSRTDGHGAYSGIEADLCRALSVAIFAAPGHVQFSPIEHIQRFIDAPGMDVVFHGLTHTLDRGRRFAITFSSIYFYDGQAFMVPRSSGIQSINQLLGKKICLRQGGEAEKNLKKYAQGQFEPVFSAEDTQAQDQFLAGRCVAYTADTSLMISMAYGKPVSSADYQVLVEKISKEPLAGITRRSDHELSHLLNATLAAIIEAEERGITAADASAQDDPKDAKKLASFTDWAGILMPSLPPDWAVRVIREVGSYGEIYERNLGKASAYGIPRGLNATWRSGGLLYALPMH